MATRSNVMLHDPTGAAKVVLYHHYDGSPESVVPELQRLLAMGQRALDGKYDSSDPEFMGAMLITLSAGDSQIPTFQPCLDRHGDIEFVYNVYLDGDEPTIEVEAM